MPQYQIDDLNDPHLEPYRELRSRNWTEQSGIFIAEGPLLAERLIASEYGVKSVLIDRKYYDHYAKLVSPEIDLIVVEHELVESIVGFNFHRGVLACGYRRPIPTVAEMFREQLDASTTIVMTVGIQDPENLGGIIRNCAALGISHIIVGPETADPLSRRVLRVSMGNAFRLQIARSRNVLQDLTYLKQVCGTESCATSLQSPCEPLESASRHGPMIILMGNERHGLPEAIQSAADRRIQIGMELGTDSLNVCVAAGIVMHYFCRIAKS